MVSEVVFSGHRAGRVPDQKAAWVRYLEGLHVVVKVFEHGRPLSQDAVAAEHRAVLLQPEHHVVCRVSRGVVHPERKRLQ